MRIVAAITAGLLALPAYAQPVLRLSHLQHFYAGGAGCVERFWLQWEGSDSEITNVDLSIEISSNGEGSMAKSLRVDRLGVSTADNSVEASFETPRCLSGNLRMVVRAASGDLEGVRIDLLKVKTLRVGKVQRVPLSISGPTIKVKTIGVKTIETIGVRPLLFPMRV